MGWKRCVAMLGLLVLAGCGGSAGETTTGSGAAASPETSPFIAHGPVVHPSQTQARAWRAIGRHACHDLRPIEAARQFERAARSAGAQKRFIQLVTEPDAAVEQSPGYPRLVAAFYATTLPEPQRVLAAAGCAQELAARG